MSVSLGQKCLALSLLALVLMSEASRPPKAFSWEHKKLPTPSSAPSKGTNSVAVEMDQKLPSSDGKV
ncbi:hypothetical protein SASPL_150057 [Salvia splendens]|uniref:Uncharacterized protein n=1 Tax=Salvia splendens TaxID=180675 RepID=A0A8X8W5W0_SALSN|nr:hypothetical protein SASPL_150057 [Salvia splendens]